MAGRLAVGRSIGLRRSARDVRRAPPPLRPPGPAKVQVGYLGLTCEAAMFVAQEKGFFKEEGLDVEFVKTDWDGLRDGLGLGPVRRELHLIMYLLKPIEQGLDVKITGGIHSGCLRVQAGAKTDIKTVEDLKGKKIGVPTALGSPPFLFSQPRTGGRTAWTRRRTWNGSCWPPEVLGLALDNGQVDAVAELRADRVDPAGAGQGADDRRPGGGRAVSDEYCCAVVVSGAFAKRDPASAAKVTRRLAQGGAVGRGEPDCGGQAVGREEVHRGLGRDQRPRDLEAEVHAGRVAVPGERPVRRAR